MAWKDTLLPPSFRGAPFEVLQTRDHGSHAVAPHEYPYLDGGEAEDMGRKARHITITAAIWGEQYETALEKLSKALDERGAAELIHPVFGSVKAQAMDWDITHTAERPNYAEVTMEFMVAGTGNPFFSRELPKVDAKTAATRTASASTLAKAVATGKNTLGMARAALGALARLKALASGVITSGLALLNSPAAFAADAASLVAGVLAMKNFSSASLFSDYYSAYAALSALFDSGDDDSGSGTGVNATAALNAGDEAEQVRAHVRLEAALGIAEAAQLVFESEAVTPTLTPEEIEAVSGTARQALQNSIDNYRNLYPLSQARAVTEPTKDVAAAVQEAAAAVLEARPPLSSHTVAARTCPRLLAHQLYGDHTRAPELVRLNRLSDPNFLTPGQELKVYAS